MAQQVKIATQLNLGGIDLVTPVDLLQEGKSPFSKNFRLQAQQKDSRRVAVSTRRGHSLHMEPLGETQTLGNAATVTQRFKINRDNAFLLQPFTANVDQRITRLDIDIKNPGGATGPILVEILEDAAGLPGNRLSVSSFLNGDIGDSGDWVTCRFINPPKLKTGKKYWIALKPQDDSLKYYEIGLVNSTPEARWTPAAWTVNTPITGKMLRYRLFTAPEKKLKGAYRFNLDNRNNRTAAVYDNTLYYADEAAGKWREIMSGLSSEASEYSFANGDGKMFWVNGHDELRYWDGTPPQDRTNIVDNGDFSLPSVRWQGSVTRDTTVYKSAPASLKITGGGQRYTKSDIQLTKGKRYKIKFSSVSAAGTSQVFVSVNTQLRPIAGYQKQMTTSWDNHEFYYWPELDVTSLEFVSTGEDFWIDDVEIIDTGVGRIVDTELPVLREVMFHKDRMWGVVAGLPNTIRFSEAPGNPAWDPTGKIPTKPSEQWYNEWRSTSFFTIPRPFNGSPVVKLCSFQDNLVVFTQDGKYIISGYDEASFNMRQSTGFKGAIARRGVVQDENAIYFVGDAGLFMFNGSSDVRISDAITPLIDGCPRITEIDATKYKDEIRFYLASSGSTVNNTCIIYNKPLKDIEYDTGIYGDRAIYYDDADDRGQLAVFNSYVGMSYYAEQQVYHDMGAPIDFEYRFKYDSMGSPMQRKRLKRFYPIFQGVDSTFKVGLAMDKDFADAPKIKEQVLSVNGARWGQFKWGDGTLYGGSKSFKPKRQSYSGYARYWQLRVFRNGVENRVAFVGAQFSYKAKRL